MQQLILYEECIPLLLSKVSIGKYVDENVENLGDNLHINSDGNTSPWPCMVYT